MNIAYRMTDFSAGRSSRGLGFAITLVLHVLLAYALVNGLGRKVIQVLQSPLEVSILDEVKPPEAKPPPTAPPVKTVRPPPAYVPPPEVPVPVQTAPAITATTSSPEPQPVEVVKAAPPVPAPASINIVCPNHATVRANVQYPAQAQRLGISGEVLVEFVVGPGGDLRDISIVRSSSAIFNTAATNAVAQLRCVGQGQDARVRVPFTFRLET